MKRKRLWFSLTGHLCKLLINEIIIWKSARKGITHSRSLNQTKKCLWYNKPAEYRTYCLLDFHVCVDYVTVALVVNVFHYHLTSVSS